MTSEQQEISNPELKETENEEELNLEDQEQDQEQTPTTIVVVEGEEDDDDEDDDDDDDDDEDNIDENAIVEDNEDNEDNDDDNDNDNDEDKHHHHHHSRSPHPHHHSSHHHSGHHSRSRHSSRHHHTHTHNHSKSRHTSHSRERGEEDDDTPPPTTTNNTTNTNDTTDKDTNIEDKDNIEHPISPNTVTLSVQPTAATTSNGTDVPTSPKQKRLVRTQRARGLTVDYTPSSLAEHSITTGLHITNPDSNDDNNSNSSSSSSSSSSDDENGGENGSKKDETAKNGGPFGGAATGITVLMPNPSKNMSLEVRSGLNRSGNRASQPPGFIEAMKSVTASSTSTSPLIQGSSLTSSLQSGTSKKLSRSERSAWRASVQLGTNVVVSAGIPHSSLTSNSSNSSLSTKSGKHTSRSRRNSISYSSSSGGSSPMDSDDDADTSADVVHTFSDEDDNEEAYAHGEEERKNRRKIGMFDAEDNDSNVRFTRIEVAGNYVGLGIPDSDGGAQAISGGTLTKLFQYATSERYSDKNFVDAFVISHRWFSDDLTILRMLKIRYIVHRIPGIHDDWNVFKRTKLNPIRFRCVNFLKTWLQLCSEDFRRSESLTSQTRKFISQIVGSDTPNGQALERALDKALLASDVGVEFTLPKPPARLAYENTLSGPLTSFLDIPAEEIARHFAAREWKMWHSIRKNEFLPGAWTCAEKEKKAPHIVKMIRASNERTNWTIWEILARNDLHERGLVINHLVSIMDYSLKLQNYNGVMEIYAGLQSVAIHRLRNTWDLLTRKNADVMARIEKLWDAEGNWANFREVLSKATPPCIPYLGFFLTDLTFIYDGNSSKIPGTELINFAKWRTVAAVLKEIGKFTKCPMNFKRNKQIGNILVPSKLDFDDDAQWNASVALEDKST